MRRRYTSDSMGCRHHLARRSPRLPSIAWLRPLALAFGGAAVALLAPAIHGQQSCDQQVNPVVCENLLPGRPASEWDVNGAGDSSIQGFATQISVDKGETVHFKVDTPAALFQIDIYRLGYYGGNGARWIAAIPNISGQQQPRCTSNGSTGLIDCGNWTESASWDVPPTATSGIYLAKLRRYDGGSSHVVFIVRNDGGQADVLFQTSDTTWQAYNTYGGNSLYVGGPGANPGRAYKVSYNRPFTTRGTNPEDWLFNAEYPMVRWLEANGYNVSYFTGVDVDRSGAIELTRHRVFLSVGHDEYWSGSQRANVEAARGAGVNLIFLSGNEVFWKTRWESSIDGSSTPYRTMVCYKETHANAAIDPMDPPIWTGTWRDPRFSPPADGGRPQNALTGTLFTVNWGGTGSETWAMKVPQTFASQPFWRNTRVATLSTGQTATLAAGTLGYEWDENVSSNRPSGLTALSSTTFNVAQKLQDYGSTYGAGTATHALTLYRHSSGALVFGAGTVQWSWGLDGHHDRSGFGSTPDTAMQQATVNLLSDMGVQPDSLQAGLLPGTSDVVAPTVALTAPANNATVSGTVIVSATASDNVGVAGVQFKLDGVNLGAEDTASPYSVSWNTASATAGAHTLTAVARDAAGNSATTPVGVTVTVGNVADITPPTVTMTGPANGATVSGPSVGVSASPSDNVAVVGVQFLLDGAPLGAEVTSTPWTMSWNTAGAPNGVHNLTARARDGAGNQTTSAAVSVTVANSTGVLSIDALAWGDRSGSQTSVTTSVFSTTAANELLLAFVGADDASAGNTVSTVIGAGLTWQLAVRTNVQRGTAEVWRAFAPATLSNVSVTATLAQSASASLTVMSIKGVDASGTNGSGAIGAVKSASASSGVPTAAVTATRSNSWVFGVGNDWDGAISRTLGANQTMVHQYLASVGDTYWVQRTNGPTSVAGTSVTINDTAPTGDRYNLSLLEVIPALAGPDTTSPTVTIATPANGATVSGTAVTVSANAADNVAVAGVQFQLDGVNLGAEDTTNPYSIGWNTTGVGSGSHILTAIARDAAGNMAMSAAVNVTVQNSGVTPPTVSITSPANGSMVSTTVTATSTATASVGVAGVQFRVDGVNVGAEDTTAPYSVTFTVPAGLHTLTAVARDTAGNSTTSGAITVTVSAGSSTALSVNGLQTFQTIDGLGANINSLSWKNGELRPALDLLIGQMGATSFRVIFDMEDWEDPNDNADPAVANSTYYNNLYSNAKFQNLWGTLHYLNQKGITGGIALSLMGRVPTWMGGSVINVSSEDEWVEMIATLLDYARNTEHVQFTLVDPLNETDNDGIEGPLVGAAQYTTLLAKLSQKLDAMGLSDFRFLGPNTAAIAKAVSTYIPQMMGNSVVMSKVNHFGLHDYSGNAGGADAAIKSSAYPTLNFWMTELGTAADVMSLIGQNASGIHIWEGYDSVYNHAILAGRGTTAPNDDCCGTTGALAYNSTTGVYTPRQLFYQLAPIFRYVPAGAVRIGTAEGNGNLTVYAFYHASSGRVTLVGRNIGASAVAVTGTLSGLPAVTTSFQFYETDLTNNFVRGADAVVSNGVVSFVAPPNSYFTLTALTGQDATAPTVAVTVPSGGATLSGTVSVTATAADAVGVVGVQFLLDGAPLGVEDLTAPYSVTWATTTTPAGPHRLSARARDVAGNVGTAVDVPVTVVLSGTLTGALAVATGTQDLPTLGTTDWAHWGLTAASSYNHRAGITAQISNFTIVGTGSATRYTNHPVGFTWTGGTPTASATATTTGVYLAGLNNGFRITVPADTTQRTLTVFAGVRSTQGKLVAHLSDNSVVDYTSTALDNTTATTAGVYTLTYRAAAAGQTLTVTFTQNTTAANARVTFQAAALK